MKTLYMALVAPVASLVLAGSAARGQNAPTSTLVPVNVKNVFIPNGFDDSNVSEVVLDGYLPNGCYKLANNESQVLPNGQINVIQYAHLYSGMCPLYVVPFTTEVKLGVLPVGQYTVTTAGEGQEGLYVKESPSGGTLPGGDEFLYAPVDSVSVAYDTVARTYVASIQGRFTNSCMGFDQIQLLDQAAVQVILPVMKVADGQTCTAVETPFTQAVALSASMTAGRHLVHVRSLNGQAVNQVFTVQAH